MQFPETNTVLFVIAVAAFFTTQFNLKGNSALACAFVVALLFNLAPLLSQSFPEAAPFIDTILNTILLMLGAAGGYDFITNTARKIVPKPE